MCKKRMRCEHFYIVYYAYERIKTLNIHRKYIQR